MSSEKTDAFVIKMADFSETSRVITFYTREFGKISTLAKGAKRLKSAFEAALDLLAHCRIVFLRKSSSSLDILTEAQLISRFRPGGNQLIHLYGGYYLAELLTALTEEYDPHPDLFDHALETLNNLASEDSPQLEIIKFELILLREIGHLPVFNYCIRCERPTSQNGPFAYWISQGGFLCKPCQHSGIDSRPIQAGTLTILNRLAQAEETALNRIQISPSQQQEMRRILSSTITYLVGKPPKLLRYIQSS